MVQDAPALLKVLGTLSGVVAAGHDPDEEAGLLRGHVLSDAGGVDALPAVVHHVEAILGQHDGEGGHAGVGEGLETVVVEVVLQVGAVALAVLVVVELDDELVATPVGEVVKGELAGAGREGLSPDDGGHVRVVVETRQEDEHVSVCGVHGVGAALHVLVPRLPVVVVQGGAACGGRARLVAQRHGGQRLPLLAVLGHVFEAADPEVGAELDVAPECVAVVGTAAPLAGRNVVVQHDVDLLAGQLGCHGIVDLLSAKQVVLGTMTLVGGSKDVRKQKRRLT